MRKVSNLFLFTLLSVLSAAGLCVAQTNRSQDSDLIRSKIEQVEQTNLTGRSTILRDTYKRALVSLYTELDAALAQDINDLKKLQSIVKSDGDSKDEIGNQLVILEKERSTNREKLRSLGEVAAVSGQQSNDSLASRGPSDEPLSSATTTVAPALSSGVASDRSRLVPQDAAPTVTPVPPVCTDVNNYPDAPELVTNEVNKLAANLVAHGNNLSFLGQNYPLVFLYTVADAVVPNGENTNRAIKQLKAYRYLAETARTDKQVGASPKSAGSTSAIEKPGFAQLLGLAVEHGAILQNVSSSTLTLSTSPYVLYTFNNGGDTQQNYERAGLLNRVGISASFNMGDSNSAVLANARRSQLSEWSARARLFGDRSTRSKAFARFWDSEIEPQIQARLSVIGSNLHLVGNDPELKKLEDDDQKALRALLERRMAMTDYKDAITAGDKEKQKKLLNDFILCYLKQAVVDPIRSGQVPLTPSVRNQLGTNFIRDLGQSLVGLEQARKRLNEKLDDLGKSPLGTFAYVNHRVPAGSDYSEFKFLYEQDQSLFRYLKLVGNVGFSLYNKPDPTLKQQKLRDFSAALSFEGKSNSPFLKGESDLSKITYAFTGSFERMPENKGVAGKQLNLAAAQFKLEIPFIAGLSLPLSVTYANGTEQQKKAHTRANFGLSFDLDKIMALTRLLQQ